MRSVSDSSIFTKRGSLRRTTWCLFSSSSEGRARENTAKPDLEDGFQTLLELRKRVQRSGDVIWRYHRAIRHLLIQIITHAQNTGAEGGVGRGGEGQCQLSGPKHTSDICSSCHLYGDRLPGSRPGLCCGGYTGPHVWITELNVPMLTTTHMEMHEHRPNSN